MTRHNGRQRDTEQEGGPGVGSENSGNVVLEHKRVAPDDFVVAGK